MLGQMSRQFYNFLTKNVIMSECAASVCQIGWKNKKRADSRCRDRAPAGFIDFFGLARYLGTRGRVEKNLLCD